MIAIGDAEPPGARRRSQHLKAVPMSPGSANSEQLGWKRHSQQVQLGVQAPKYSGESSLVRPKTEFSVPASTALPFCFFKDKGAQDSPGAGAGGREGAAFYRGRHTGSGDR